MWYILYIQYVDSEYTVNTQRHSMQNDMHNNNILIIPQIEILYLVLCYNDWVSYTI